ncbi:MAG: T9SS type A sorting domain-containing protein [Flavobacteriales bacterium]|nr:T9SS type A sorting domain-containing protein [Flavobacteriales bacterium]
MLTAILIAHTPQLFGQLSYSFTETAAPYQPLVNATSCSFDTTGLDRINEVDGELFQLFGVPFPVDDDHPLHLGANGFLRVDDDSSLIIVDGLFTTLEIHDQNSDVRYTLSGTPGARTLKAEWHRWHLSNGPAQNFASWQVHLEQATGIITIHIGPNSGSGQLFTNSNGPNCGIFHSPNTFSTCYEKIWLEGMPDALMVDSTANFDFDAFLGFPEANTVYRFTPRTSATGVETASLLAAPYLTMQGTTLQLNRPGAAEPIELCLLDVNGRLVHRAWVTGDTWQFDMERSPSGIYLLQGRTGAGTFTKRFSYP